MSKSLYCGAGKANITPPAELIPLLPGLMNARFSGIVYDELFVRAIAFRSEKNTVLFVSFDLDKAPNPAESLAAISAKTGIPEKNILFFGVHTHTAPVTSVRPYEQKNSRTSQSAEIQATMHTYETLVHERMLSAVESALSNLEPAKIGWSTGESYINVNRCQDYVVELPYGTVQHCCSLGVNPTGPVDHTLFVLKAENFDGKPIAFFVNYAVHCCVMISNNSDGSGKVGISGDLAGVTSQLMEEKYGAVSIWSSGAAGDINPIMMNQYQYPDPKTGAAMEFQVSSAETALTALRLLSSRHMADIASVERKIHCSTTVASITATEGLCSTPGRDLQAYSVKLHPITIGDLVFCGIGGELYTTLGWAMQKISPAAHTCIINHDASLLYPSDYIMDDDTIARCEQNLSGHFIPGYGKSCILPGYLADALPYTFRQLLTHQ